MSSVYTWEERGHALRVMVYVPGSASSQPRADQYKTVCLPHMFLRAAGTLPAPLGKGVKRWSPPGARPVGAMWARQPGGPHRTQGHGVAFGLGVWSWRKRVVDRLTRDWGRDSISIERGKGAVGRGH